MAYLTKRTSYDDSGKKIVKHVVIWHDWKKSEDERASRREVSCLKRKATNDTLRKRLLEELQAKEDESYKQLKLYGSNKNLDRPEYEIKSLVDEYLQMRKEKVQLRVKTLKEGSDTTKGIAETTYRENDYSLRILIEFCDKKGLKRCKQFTPEKAKELRDWLELQGRSPRSNSKIATNIKQFIKNYEDYRPAYFADSNLIVKKLQNFKSKKNLPRVFSIQELNTLLKTALELDSTQCTITRESKDAGKSFNGDMPNKYAPVLPLVLLLTFTGMRLNEALLLQWSDVNLKTGKINITAKKTHSDRTFILVGDRSGTISNTMLEILRHWKLKAGSNKYVLPTETDTPVLSKWGWKRFRDKSNIKDNTPKNFRSTFVTYALSWGIPIPVLSFYTGHSMDVISKHYFGGAVDRLAGDTLEAVMGLDRIMQEILNHYKGGQSLIRKQA